MALQMCGCIFSLYTLIHFHKEMYNSQLRTFKNWMFQQLLLLKVDLFTEFPEMTSYIAGAER